MAGINEKMEIKHQEFLSVLHSVSGASIIDIYTHTHTQMSTASRNINLFICFSKLVIYLNLKHSDKDEAHGPPYA